MIIAIEVDIEPPYNAAILSIKIATPVNPLDNILAGRIID